MYNLLSKAGCFGKGTMAYSMHADPRIQNILSSHVDKLVNLFVVFKLFCLVQSSF